MKVIAKAREKKIIPNNELAIGIRKNGNIKELRGLIRFKKPAQQIKDDMKKGWNSNLRVY